MKSLLLISLLLAANVCAQDKNVVALRFSQDTLRALTTAADTAIFPLSGRSPNPIYDETTKLLDQNPILAWLQKHQMNSRPLAATDMGHLRALILSPENHHGGLFSVGETELHAISFTSDGKQGFIVLGYSLVSIFWDGKRETALLNDIGARKVQKWIKTNG